MAHLLEKIDILLPYAVTTIRLFNEETGELEPAACKNLDEDEWKKNARTVYPGLGRKVLHARAPLIILNLQKDPRSEDGEYWRRRGFVSYLAAPLVAHGIELGVIAFYTREEHDFTGEEIELLCTLARQASIAIHNAQLHQQRDQLAAIVESSNDAIVGRTLDGTVTTWNKAAETMFGYTAAEMKGRSIEVLLPAGSHDLAPVSLDQLNSPQTLGNHEVVRLRKDGKPIYVSLGVSQITDTYGNLTGFAAIYRDITERKRAEEGLKKHTEVLQEIFFPAQWDPKLGIHVT